MWPQKRGFLGAITWTLIFLVECHYVGHFLGEVDSQEVNLTDASDKAPESTVVSTPKTSAPSAPIALSSLPAKEGSLAKCGKTSTISGVVKTSRIVGVPMKDILWSKSYVSVICSDVASKFKTKLRQLCGRASKRKTHRQADKCRQHRWLVEKRTFSSVMLGRKCMDMSDMIIVLRYEALPHFA